MKYKLGKRIYNKYGKFSEDGREFIIHNPATPRPWINYLSNGRYCSLISQTGGGYSFYLDPTYNRVTRWSPENYISDVPGRYVYIRDNRSDEYFSNCYKPVKKGRNFKCVHGFGYTVFKNEYNGIECESKYFVPLNDDVELWQIKLKNRSRHVKNLSVFPFAELLCGGWFSELEIRNISILHNRGSYDKKLNSIIAGKYPFGNKPWDYKVFFTTNLKVKDYDVDFEKFIGRYNDYSNPEAVSLNKCTNSRVSGSNMTGALRSEIKLKPGTSRQFYVMLGIVKDKTEIRKLKKKYSAVNRVTKELTKTKQYWLKLIRGNVEVETPDMDLNLFINNWLKYQVIICNHWSRSATFYHEGGGAFGYRNTAQDAFGILTIDLDFAKNIMLKLAEHQYSSGQCMAGWSLERGPDESRPAADFPMWLPFLVISYIKESGDFKILKRKIRYHDKGSDSLYIHLYKAMKYLQDISYGEHGLPLMGTQDWNDAFDRTGIGGKGESVMLAMGLLWALRNFAELSGVIGQKKIESDCIKRYDELRDNVNKVCWEGSHYIRAYNDKGEKIGSKKNKEGKYFLNSQTWGIVSGAADEKQKKKIFKLIDKELNTGYGPVLFRPCYTEYDGNIGRITAFAEGTKENAALFIHGAAFKIAADLLSGRGNKAYETFKRTAPYTKDPEVYMAEPYVYPEYIIGPGNPRYGEGTFTWLTGSSDWMYMNFIQNVCGLVPDYEGLKIKPVIPSAWKKLTMKRKFRGAEFELRLLNPDGVESSVKEIKVNGKRIESDIIRNIRKGKKYVVEVIMG